MIKIKKCSYKDKADIEYWYKDKIGQSFEVLWDTFGYYFVKNEIGCNYINREDIED